MARLKVFGWSDGLRTYAVATTSRPKALAAWGVRQDLFKEGLAREIDDPALVKAALAQPDVAVAAPVKGGAAKAVAAAKAPAKPKGPTPAERQEAAFRRRLAELEAAHFAELADLAAQRQALDSREADLKARFERARSGLAAERADAKKTP